VEEADHSPRLVRFGTFEVDLKAGELRKSGVKLKLTGQPFQVFTILLEHPGQVVTRDELQKRLWPDTFVDVDHNLNTAINKIREALGDSTESPRFIATLPRRGYRFIGPVDEGLRSKGCNFDLHHPRWFAKQWENPGGRRAAIIRTSLQSPNSSDLGLVPSTTSRKSPPKSKPLLTKSPPPKSAINPPSSSSKENASTSSLNFLALPTSLRHRSRFIPLTLKKQSSPAFRV
jgi:DNA-binding winged helix-turn-helix (wHTH) protein